MRMGTMRKGWLIAALALAVVILGVGLLAFKSLTGSTARSWRIEVVDNEGNVGLYTSIALDKNGWPHISYYDTTNGDLKYAYWTGENWEIEAVDNEGRVGQYTSIALDSADHPHISYFDVGNGHLKYAQWTGSAWSVETVDNGENVGLYTSIAVDSDGCSHISYYDLANDDLKYAHWTAGGWRIETVDNENGGPYTSIALDSAGFPHISYYNAYHGDLNYARWDGGKWEIEAADADFHHLIGTFTSIDLDKNDLPCIAYAICPGEMDVFLKLRYARWTGETWEVEEVDGTIDDWRGSNVGWYTSMVLDSHDFPHISYHDKSMSRGLGNFSLKYAWWDGSKWKMETIDNGWDVGEFTSIAVDGNDCPHISYYSGSLKYATVEVTTDGASRSLWPAAAVMAATSVVGTAALVKRKFLKR